MPQKTLFRPSQVLILLFALLISLGCIATSTGPQALTSPPPAPTETQAQKSPTHTPRVEITPAATIDPAATPPPGLVQQWTVRTGDLLYFGAVPDGRVFGLGRKVYAILGGDGQLIQANQVEFPYCIRENYYGGAGASNVGQFFIFRADGTIYSTARVFNVGVCKIMVSDPPAVVTFPDSILDYTFLNGDPPPVTSAEEDEEIVGPDRRPGVPDRYIQTLGGDPFWQDDLRDGRDLYLSADRKSVGFLNRQGKFFEFLFPSDFDWQKNAVKGIHFIIMPWEEIYFTYEGYDVIGNSLGTRSILIQPDGTYAELEEMPEIFAEPIVRYLPGYEEFFVLDKRQRALLRLDRQFAVQGTYVLPDSFQVVDDNPGFFIGFDSSVYLFNRSNQTLTKFIITGDPELGLLP